MTTPDARKRLTEAIDRLERTRTHSIDPQTGQFTRLDQEDNMHDHRTDADALIDYAVETSREHPKRAARNVSLAQVHALLAIHDTLTEIRDRLPEPEAEAESEHITCMTCGASLKAGDPLDCAKHAPPADLTEPAPVPHPDEALAEVLNAEVVRMVRAGDLTIDADDGDAFERNLARVAREHIEANQLYAYRTVAAERDKAEAELARVTKERDEAIGTTRRYSEALDGLRYHFDNHPAPTVYPSAVARRIKWRMEEVGILALDDARAEGQS